MSNGIAVVIPTCRPLELEKFLTAWRDQFDAHRVKVIVVHDSKGTWDTMPDFIPRRTGAIRSWGFLQAWREGYDVLTLDDDCLPLPGVDLIGEYKEASRHRWPSSDYFDIGHTFGVGEFMRGFPFMDREVRQPLIQFGGWVNVPDLDAVTQRAIERTQPIEGYEFDNRVLAIPKGIAFTGCGMNVSIKHEAIPMMYQLMMGVPLVGYDRWDDIWSALFAKKICDHLDVPILVNGRASVIHSRASDTDSNFAKEVGGYELNDAMWRNLASVTFKSTSVIGCYEELTRHVNPAWFGKHGVIVKGAMWKWIAAINEGGLTL